MFQVVAKQAISVNDFAKAWNQILSRVPINCSVISKITDEKFKVGISLSGGSDSTALAHLAIEYFGLDRVHLFTVNHNVPNWLVEPTERIQQMARNQWGTSVKHSILNLSWNESVDRVDKPEEISKSHLQNQCRIKRYKALFLALREKSIPFLLTGHNFEDDFVTSCHRLAKYSGIDGIAGMKPLSTIPLDSEASDEVLLARPFLDIPKQQLQQTCSTYNLQWVEDPTNGDIDFARNSSMQTISKIQQLNPTFTFERMHSFMKSLKDHRNYLQQRVLEAANQSLLQTPNDATLMLVMNDSKWPFCMPVAWRLVNFAIQSVSCISYPPSTPSCIVIATKIQAAYKAFLEARKRDMSKIPKNLLAQFTNGDANLYWQSKRLELGQQTLAGSVVYPLASSDVITRFREYKHVTKKQPVPGPSLLITAALRSKSSREHAMSICIESNDYATKKEFIWSNRFRLFLTVKPTKAKTRNLIVRSLSLEFLKQHSNALRKSAALGRIYTFMGSTPSPFFVNYPLVIDAEDESKFAIPHLKFASSQCDFDVEASFIGVHILMSKLYLE